MNIENSEVNESEGGANGDKGGEDKVNAGAIRKSTTASILKAAQTASGLEFQSVEEMMSALARLSATQAASQPQHQPKQSSEPAEETQPRKRVTNTDLEDKFLQLQKDMQAKEAKLRERELDNNIRNALGDRFDGDLVDYTINRIKSQLVEQDGEWIIVNGRQQQRYTDSGKPMTIRDLVEEMARDNPKLLRQQPVQGGSGLRPQGGVFGGEGLPGDNEVIPDYQKDPAAFNAWASKRGLGRNNGLKGVTASVFSNDTTKRVM